MAFVLSVTVAPVALVALVGWWVGGLAGWWGASLARSHVCARTERDEQRRSDNRTCFGAACFATIAA
ncbi:MAG: hypothetical protein JNK05_38005 [Myxococcales bacterium]|nr:hypothetical protein [Myxococcales bacterium]